MGTPAIEITPTSRRYPARPVVGVGAVVVHEGKVLLVQRGHEPLMGYWSIPGGAVETGERLEQALLREVMEETGLAVKPLFLTAVFERLMPDVEGKTEFHYVLIDFVCALVDAVAPGSLPGAMAGDDAAALGWYALDEAATLPMTAGTYEVVAKAMVAYDQWRASGDTDQADLSPFVGLWLPMPTGDYGLEEERS